MLLPDFPDSCSEGPLLSHGNEYGGVCTQTPTHDASLNALSGASQDTSSQPGPRLHTPP